MGGDGGGGDSIGRDSGPKNKHYSWQYQAQAHLQPPHCKKYKYWSTAYGGTTSGTPDTWPMWIAFWRSKKREPPRARSGNYRQKKTKPCGSFGLTTVTTRPPPVPTIAPSAGRNFRQTRKITRSTFAAPPGSPLRKRRRAPRSSTEKCT